jgi:hypothetical protein
MIAWFDIGSKTWTQKPLPVPNWTKLGDSVKKKIILIVMASFLLTGVVSAASLWGSYKGNAIIKVNVNDKQYTTKGVPPVSLNGQVMIPLNILKQLGITYTYDSKKMTANITKPEPEIVYIDNGENANDVELLKAYVKAADYYKGLSNLGDMINGLSGHLSLVFDGDSLGYGTKPDYARLNRIIDSYNFYANDFDNKQKQFNNYNIDLSMASKILDLYSNALDAYKKSFAGMDGYVLTHSETNFDNYLDNSKKGSDSSSDTQYNVMISIALNQ